MFTMTTNNQKLTKKIIKLKKKFCTKSNDNCEWAMHSRPEWANIYNDQLELYGNAIEICDKYVKTLDFKEFVKEIIKIGLDFELQPLRKYICDPVVLERLI